ncbi:dihydropteroate synthase [Microbacterium sp. NC79]|uniref:dihydropteroate synthase n=1 Tax=Microbacterium sp. NC79 TaxID=2851009 RepID=UPI001C2BC906|nr:dihydropteroate synthase [Microbacterium sp. NC79]MBV0895796.1 dihydropteroate synthase [Microbacterium sp. NC79]
MTQLWGIVNVTPDSFSDGGRYASVEAAITHGRELLAAGAHVLDIGGESTRPGSERVPVEVEQHRVIPVIEALAAEGATISIDTMNASTAAAAVRAGARYVNDVAGGLADPDMYAAVADSGADYVLGHWRGPSSDMYAQAHYTNVGAEVAAEVADRLAGAIAAGIAPERIVVDPGVGFAKTAEHNWALLRELNHVTGLGHRVLIGTSRKRFLTTALGDSTTEEQRDLATAVTSVLAAQAGAWAVRVHNVAASRDALAVARTWQGVIDD